MKVVAALRTPRVALWKCRPVESVENSQNEFPTLPTGLGNPAKDSRIPTFPQRRRRVYL
jgi:hypothetical protein